MSWTKRAWVLLLLFAVPMLVFPSAALFHHTFTTDTTNYWYVVAFLPVCAVMAVVEKLCYAHFGELSSRTDDTGGGSKAGHSVCDLCKQSFGDDEVVAIGESIVCGKCKSLAVQRLKEGPRNNVVQRKP